MRTNPFKNPYLFIKTLQNLTVCAAFLASSSHALAKSTSLPDALQFTLKNAGINSNQIGLVVMPAKAGTPLIQHQGNQSFQPASTMKLVSTFIALDELKPNFKWKTQIYSSQLIQDGVLNGDLYVKGGGDPNLTHEKLSLMLRQLRQQGLKEVNGNVVLDRNYFQPIRTDASQTPFDDTPDSYYNVIPDAFLLHSNITAIPLNSLNGNEVKFSLATPMTNITLKSELKIGKGACEEFKRQISTKISYLNNGNAEIGLQGSFPVGCQATLYANILDRNFYIENMFRALWLELGGTWNGKLVEGYTPNTSNLLLQRESETLGDTLRIINKTSDNAMARLTYLTLGSENSFFKNFTKTSEAANTVVNLWFTKNQIDTQGFVIENGSGLSRNERITPLQMAFLLRSAANSVWFYDFISSLPIGGLDGTMRNRLKGTNAEYRARVKTGYIKNVVAISGYVTDAQSKEWIVVAFINAENLNVAKARAAIDEILNWVASPK